jgi:hypothetical protein
MNIGIYGDSFANAKHPDQATCWYKIVAEQLGGVYDNYSKPGSSIYFSYNEFIKTCNRYDLNIFLVSRPDRFPEEVKFSNNRSRYISSLDNVNLLKNNIKLSKDDEVILNNLSGWFNIPHTRFHRDMADLMIDKIETLHDNTIIIPCFSNSFRPNRFIKYGLDPDNTMHSMHIRQFYLLGMDTYDTPSETEIMCGHLGPEWNTYFANVLYKRITTDKWDYSGFYDVKMEHPANYYYYL